MTNRSIVVRSYSLLLLIALLGACAHPAPPGPASSTNRTPGSAPKVLNAVVLSGSDNVVVTLLELDNDRALIRLEGAKGDLFGKVIEHIRAFSDKGVTRYTTTFNGKPFTTLAAGEKEGKELWELLTPDKNFRVPVFRDRLKTEHLDTEALIRQHQAQDADGTLAALAKFDRERNERAVLDEVWGPLRSATTACGIRPRLEVNWSSISTQQLLGDYYSTKLGVLLRALETICRSTPGKAFFQAHPTQRVSFGADPAVSIDGRALRWTLPHDLQFSDVGKVLVPLHALPLQGRTLVQLIIFGTTEICQTPEDRLIILSPKEAEHTGISYGKGDRFTHISKVASHKVWIFFDPRFSIKNVDYSHGRHLSKIYHDTEANVCTLECGDQKKELTLLPRAAIPPILDKATYHSRPHLREPYALARNRQGIYYFVDRGTTATTRKDFRVFIGRRGRMQAQQMRDIVSDSKGEIFSTRSGELRLVISKTQAIWITKRREHELLWLPLQENTAMIYNELGPYLGQPLGTPCDDF